MRTGQQLSAWIYALAVACLFLAVRGYVFNAGDQSEHLPQVYQILDPALYSNDYFVPATQAQFTVRHFYEKLALFLAHTIGLEWGAFLLTLLCITAMAFAFHQIAWRIFKERWAAWLAPVLVLLVFYHFTVGGNHIAYNSLISSSLGKALASVALLQLLHRKWALAGVLLGMASLFQVLVGLQLMLILTLAVPFMARERRVAAILQTWAGYLIIALFILVPTMQQQFGGQGAYDHALYYDVLYRFRNYHHYLPSLFPVTHYVKFFGILMLGFVAYRFTRPSDRGLYAALVVPVLLGMVIYAIGLEVLSLQFLGKIQWFKTSVWAVGLSAVMVAGLVGMQLQSLIPAETISRKMPWVSATLSVLLLVVMINSVWLPPQYDGRYAIGNRNPTNLEKMHQWIAANISKDAMILVPPDDNGFSCQAKRPMPVHFHAIIHEPGFMMPWYEKIRTVYGLGLEDIDSVNARTLASERYAMRNYRGSEFSIRYRLDNAETCAFDAELGPLIHQEGPWLLTEFRPE